MTARAPRDAWIAAGVALAARLGVVAWAAPRFPAAADGAFYDLFARRLASGAGYTKVWPDGVVTNVAHYPVGYPALLAVAYRALGPSPAAAMTVNALFGAAMAFAAHRLLRDATSRGLALAGALVVALHPALVPYTAAVMTEGVSAALLAMAAAAAANARGGSWRWLAGAGLALGVATLVRPQCLAFAPVLGAIAVRGGGARRLRGALVVSALAVATCLPWTARNCVAMKKCALVSVNGGWNLLIGAQTTSGSWQPLDDVPVECRTVWDEAGKDECFGAAARAMIVRAPGAWLARVPAKLAVTFDYFGGAPWYLHEANAGAFDDRAKWRLAAVETAFSRVVLLAALFAMVRLPGPRRPLRLAIGLAGVVSACVVVAWPAYLALAAGIAALGPRAWARAPLVVPWTAVVIAATAATHAVFFGAGRYGLVVAPFVALVAFARRARPIPCDARTSWASSTSSVSASVDAAARS